MEGKEEEEWKGIEGGRGMKEGREGERENWWKGSRVCDIMEPRSDLASWLLMTHEK